MTDHFLAPDDFATIYNLGPLYNAGYRWFGPKDRRGRRVRCGLGRYSNVPRSYGLPKKDPQVVLVPGGPDPGFTDSQGEADLDIEWAGAVARNANIIYVYSTECRGLRALCDRSEPRTHHHSQLRLVRTANCSSRAIVHASVRATGKCAGNYVARGVGDSGAAGCDRPFVPGAPKASLGLAVAFPASLPEVTAVGGTQFDEAGGNYWATSNSSTFASALSYIPERAWNESGRSGLAASGGGLSKVFTRPLWQAGPGVPSLNFRAVPDVALSAAGHDGYLIVSEGGVIIDIGNFHGHSVLCRNSGAGQSISGTQRGRNPIRPRQHQSEPL